ncbi:MAG: hypothetical protein PHD36_04155 [Desulfotomaculaceae bacterium]|nr:hypothetical protein [Desulfotomaculaceae bacterium]
MTNLKNNFNILTAEFPRPRRRGFFPHLRGICLVARGEIHHVDSFSRTRVVLRQILFAANKRGAFIKNAQMGVLVLGYLAIFLELLAVVLVIYI